MTTPKPPGLHPLAWEYLCAVREVQQADDEITTAYSDHFCGVQRRAEDAWGAEGCPLLDEDGLPEPVAWCRECGRVSSCDEDRCCSMCGYDLIVLADLHSAEVLEALWEDRDLPVDETPEPPPADAALLAMANRALGQQLDEARAATESYFGLLDNAQTPALAKAHWDLAWEHGLLVSAKLKGEPFDGARLEEVRSLLDDIERAQSVQAHIDNEMRYRVMRGERDEARAEVERLRERMGAAPSGYTVRADWDADETTIGVYVGTDEVGRYCVVDDPEAEARGLRGMIDACVHAAMKAPELTEVTDG
jgi:hypothetical protein